MNAALVIMAAGMGSRYGGEKQTDGIGPHGEAIMEYSVYDAVRAGFRKIVFIIKPGMEAHIRTLCGDRIATMHTPQGEQVEVAYAVPQAEPSPLGLSTQPCAPAAQYRNPLPSSMQMITTAHPPLQLSWTSFSP